MKARQEQEHKDLISKIAEHRAYISKVAEDVALIGEHARLDSASTQQELAAVSQKIDDVTGSITSIRNVGEQLLTYVAKFPKEIRDLLRVIVQRNWQMYQLLLKIQDNTSRSPTSIQNSNIRFTNALGEYRELPYEFFCQWEPFEGFLRAQFKGKPGEQKVQDGHFHMLDMDDDSKAVIQKEHWHRFVAEGANLTMSMIMSHIEQQSGNCPRPGCKGAGLKLCNSARATTWYDTIFPTYITLLTKYEWCLSPQLFRILKRTQ